MFQRQGGVSYWQDNETQQGSLGTKDKQAALKLIHAKNKSHEQPILNLALIRIRAGADPIGNIGLSQTGRMCRIRRLRSTNESACQMPCVRGRRASMIARQSMPSAAAAFTSLRISFRRPRAESRNRRPAKH